MLWSGEEEEGGGAIRQKQPRGCVPLTVGLLFGTGTDGAGGDVTHVVVCDYVGGVGASCAAWCAAHRRQMESVLGQAPGSACIVELK